jgi:hypothetical protein
MPDILTLRERQWEDEQAKKKKQPVVEPVPIKPLPIVIKPEPTQKIVNVSPPDKKGVTTTTTWPAVPISMLTADQEQIATRNTQNLFQDTIKKIYPEMFDPKNSYGYSEDEIPNMVSRTVMQNAADNPEQFMQDLLSKNQPQEAETLLKLLGANDNDINQLFNAEERQNRVSGLVSEVLPGYDLESFTNLVESDFPKFVETIRTGPRTKAKQDLLLAIGVPPTELGEYFRMQKVVVPINGVRELVTVDNSTGQAFDADNRLVGRYNPVTQEFTPQVPESIAKDTFDAIKMGISGAMHSQKQFFATVIPEMIYGEIPESAPIPDGLREYMNETNKTMREGFKKVATFNQNEYNTWIKKHPELDPKPNYTAGWSEHPELMKDPEYWVYEFASTAPVSLTAMVMVYAGGLTGNVPLGVLGSAAIMTGTQGTDTYNQLIEAGAPSNKAAWMAAGVDVFANLVEAFSDVIYLKTVAPALSATFRKAITAEVSSAVMGKLVSKGILEFNKQQFLEVMEEVATQAVANAALKVYKKDVKVWDGLLQTAAKTWVASAPFSAVAGASASMPYVNVANNISVQFDDATKLEMGWQQNPATKEWQRQMTPFEFGSKLVDAGLLKLEDIKDLYNKSVISSEQGSFVPDAQPGETPLTIDKSLTPIQDIVDKIKTGVTLSLEEEQFRVNNAQSIENTLYFEKVKAETPTTPLTVQTGLAGMGVPGAQSSKLGEFQGSQIAKQPLIDTEAIKAKEANKPLEGQIGLPSEVFKNTTDVPYYDAFIKDANIAKKKGYIVNIVEMSPDEYISKSAQIQGTNIAEQMRMVEPELVEKYSQMMLKGTKFDLPYLDYKLNEQEGRARALAAKKLGITNIPVLIANNIETPAPTSQVATPIEETGLEVSQLQTNIEVAQQEYDNNPATPFIDVVQKSGDWKGQIDHLTVNQYRLLTGAKWETQKAEVNGKIVNKRVLMGGKFPTPHMMTADGKYVRWEVLDTVAESLGFDTAEHFKNGIEDALKQKNKLQEMKDRLKVVSPMVSESGTVPPVIPPSQPPTTVSGMMQEPKRSNLPATQRAKNKALFIQYIVSGESKVAYELQSEMRKQEHAERIANYFERAKELTVDHIDKDGNEVKALKPQEAMNQAVKETLPGEYTVLTDKVIQETTNDIVDDLFWDIWNFFKDKPDEQWDAINTKKALENYPLLGKPIPDTPGREGGSAWSLLNRIWGNQPQVMKALEKMSEEQKPIKDVVEGIFHEIGREPGHTTTMTESEIQAAKLGGTQQIFVPNDFALQLQTANALPSEIKEITDARTTELKELAWLKLKQKYFPESMTEAEKALFDAQANAVSQLNFRVQIGQTIPDDLKQVLTYAPTGKLELIQPPSTTKFIEDIEALRKWVEETRNKKFEKLTPFEKEMADQIYKLTLREEELKLNPHKPMQGEFQWESEIEKAIQDTMPGTPRIDVDGLVRALKYVGLTTVDIFNFIRANMASVDFSAVRTGIKLIMLKPQLFPRAFARYVKSTFSEKATQAYWAKNTTGNYRWIEYQKLVDKGTDFLRQPDVKVGMTLAQVNEEFGSAVGNRPIQRLTRWLPWVKAGNRGFSTFINEMTMPLFNEYYDEIKLQGEEIAKKIRPMPKSGFFNEKELIKGWMHFLAVFSGHASLGPLQGSADLVSAVAFAGRSFASQVESPAMLISPNPHTAKAAWRSLITFAGLIATIGYGGAALGYWEFDDDPESGGFGDIIIDGKIHLDLTAGNRQWFVFLYRLSNAVGHNFAPQIFSGQATDSSTGRKYDINIEDLVNNLFSSKSSSMLSIVKEFITQENYFHEKVDYGSLDQWLDRVGWMSVVGIREVWKENWKRSVELAVPSMLGFSTNVYGPEDTYNNLGIPDTEYLEAGIVKPVDTGEYWSSVNEQFSGVDAKTMKERGADPRQIATNDLITRLKEEINTLPSEKPIDIDNLPFWKSKWLEREAIVVSGDKVKLEQFDANEVNKKAYLGNISQSLYVTWYQWSLIKDRTKQVQFEKEHPELMQSPRDKQLLSDSALSGQLSVFGKAKIRTQEAYNAAQAFIKKYDIPTNAIPDMSLPPETSIKTHFAYEDMVANGKETSWEAQLLLQQDAQVAKDTGVESYVAWKGLKLSTTPTESLELKTEKTYRDIYNTIADYRDSTNKNGKYIADEKVREKAVNDLKDTAIDKDNNYRDVEYRIEALEKGTNEVPIDDNLVEKHIQFSQLENQPGLGGSSAEVMLYRVDNPDYNEWRMNKYIWGNQVLKPVDETKVAQWRIDAKYRPEDDWYTAGITEKHDAMPYANQNQRDDAIRKERAKYLADNPEYNKARFTRDALTLTNTGGEHLPLVTTEQYVEYRSLEQKGYEQERYLLEHPEFANAMNKIAKTQLPDKTKVPAKQYDDIYKQFKDSFDKWDSYGNVASDEYIGNDRQRLEARNILDRNSSFKTARMTRDAYKDLIGAETYVPLLVKYRQIVAKGNVNNADYWFDDDWFLMNNPQLYKEMVKRKLIQPRVFTKVPPQDVWQLYVKYDSIKGSGGNEKDKTYISKEDAKREYRRKNPKLDSWLVLIGAVSKSIEEYDAEKKVTADKTKKAKTTSTQDKILAKNRQIADLRNEINLKLKALALVK